MTALVILVEASPRRVADGVVEAVRLAGAGAVKPYRYPDAAGGGDQSWRAGIVSLPTIICALDFDGTDLGTGAVPQAAEIVWAPARSADLNALAAYFWFDAAIKVRIGPEGASPPVAIAGKVLNALVVDGQLRVQLADPAATLKKPFPVTRYLGTGDLEGPVEWSGKLKDRVWGRVWNKLGEPLDKANNIYAFADPARPLQSIDAVRDKGAAAAALTTIAWQGTAAATLAALRASSAPQGGGVTCPSLACVKWWTQPAGDLCADLKGEVGAGYVETTAEIASLLVAALAGPAFAVGTVAAAVAARAAPIGWVVNDDSTTVATMLDELLGNASLLWVLNSTGEIVIRAWAWGVSVATARSQRVTRNSTMRPVHTRKIGYQRNELPMARGDLAAIVLASDATYLDGTPIEALKPGEAGANVTEGRTAAAIAGQGALATKSTITYGIADIPALPGALRPANMLLGGDYLRADWLVYQDGVTSVEARKPGETGANVTEARTAAAIAGQGAFATKSSANWSEVNDGTLPSAIQSGNLAAGGYLKLSLAVYNDGTTGNALKPGEAGANVTEGRTAAAIAGQGSFATRSTITYGAADMLSVPFALQPGQLSGGDYVKLALAVYNSGASGESLKPGEIGANVTEGRTAAAIAGQGALATRSDVQDGYIGGNLAIRLAPHPLNNQFLSTATVAYSDGANMDPLKPAEGGANVTATHTAAAIAGQGAFATRSSATWSEVDDASRPLALKDAGFFGSGYMKAAGLYNAAGNKNLETYYPEDVGSNRTETRVAAAIAGQGGLATRSTINFNGSDIASLPAAINPGNMIAGLYLDAGLAFYDGGTSVSIQARKPAEAGANVTESRTAAAIAGQTGWATLTASTARVGKIADTGRVLDPTIYNTQQILGVSNTTNLSPTYTVGGSNVTVNLPAHTRKVAGASGPVTLSYGAVSGVVAFSAYWTAYIDDPDLTGIASPSVTFTSNPDDLLYPGRYQIASGVAPAANGTGGGTGSGGGSGGGWAGCVADYSWIEVLDAGDRQVMEIDGRSWVPAGTILPGDQVRILTLDCERTEWSTVTANRVEPQHGVRIRHEIGAEIDLSASTPITLRDGSTVLAPLAFAHEIAADVDGMPVWGTCTVEDIGVLLVAHISCSDGTYLAANVPGRGVYSHNIAEKP